MYKSALIQKALILKTKAELIKQLETDPDNLRVKETIEKINEFSEIIGTPS